MIVRAASTFEEPVEILNSMFLPYKTFKEWEFLASVDFLRKGLTLEQVAMAAR